MIVSHRCSTLAHTPAAQQSLSHVTACVPYMLSHFLQALCESFPSFADACKVYVDTYAPLVFNLLQQVRGSNRAGDVQNG